MSKKTILIVVSPAGGFRIADCGFEDPLGLDTSLCSYSTGAPS